MTSLRRIWCFLVHRWWVGTHYVPSAWPHYACDRCGELWTRE